MQPPTVKRWHEQGFRLFWRWKSSRRRGRPAIARHLRALIRQMSQENRLWGAERIRDTIALLGFPKLDVETVRKYMAGGRCQMEEVRTAFRCPWQNPFVERFGGSLRREVLDHVIVLNEAHLERLLKEYIEEFYHLHRPHQGLEGQTPEPSPRSLQPPSSVIAIPVLGGLHHHYVPVAA